MAASKTKTKLAPVRGMPMTALRRFLIDDWKSLILLTPSFLWLGLFFMIPLGVMAWTSLASEGFSARSYLIILTSAHYGVVMMTTFKIAITVTIGALFLAYPVAYVLAISHGVIRAVLLVGIIIPYWVDAIVRSFAWLIMLGDNGLINKTLIGIGIIHQPLPLLYNFFTVVVVMVQVLLPMTIIILFGAMLRIDRTLTTAARIHGASEWRAFWTIFFPLSLPGVYGAGLLVFVISLGFYIVPALLGSPNETMIAQTIMIEAQDLLDWAVASAAGILLLIAITAILTVYNIYFNIGRLWGETER